MEDNIGRYEEIFHMGDIAEQDEERYWDEYYERDYTPRTKISQDKFQDKATKWRRWNGYIEIKEILDDHLVNIIHLVERRKIKEYENFPKNYKHLLREARKRKLIR